MLTMFYVWYKNQLVFKDDWIGRAFEYSIYLYLKARAEAGTETPQTYPYVSLFPFEDATDPSPVRDCYRDLVLWACRQQRFLHQPRWLLPAECPDYETYVQHFLQLHRSCH